MKFPDTRSTSLLNPRRTFAVVALALFGLASTAMAAGPQTRLDNALVFRAALNDSSSTQTCAIVMLRPGAQLPAEFEPYATRRLQIIDGYVVNVTQRGAGAPWRAPLRARHPSRSARHQIRLSDIDQRRLAGRQSIRRPDRRRHRRRRHRLGHHLVARRPDELARSASIPGPTSASRRSSTSSAATVTRTTTTATARTSPASSPATATTRTARRPASRLMRISSR